MAFDFFKDDEEDIEGGSSQAPQAAQQQVGPSQGGMVEQESPQQGGADQPSKSGSFTNLQSYLDANAATEFGQKVAGDVEGDVQGARQAQDTAEQGFKQAADTGSYQTDQGLLDRVGSDAVGLAADETEAARFKALRDAQYKGPNALEDREELYNPAQQKTAEASELAGLTGSEGGRKALLDRFYGAGVGKYDYTSGEKKLDNLLIQNDPGARQAFEGVRGQAEETSGRFSKIEDALKNYAQSKAEETAQARAAARGAIGIDEQGQLVEGQGALGAAYGGIDKAFQDRSALQSKQLAELNKAFKTGDYRKLDPKLKAMVGIGGGTGSLFNVDPSKYLSATKLSAPGTSSEEQGAQLQALSSLADVESKYGQGQFGTQDNEDFLAYDKDKLNQMVGSKKAQYANELNSTPVRLINSGMEGPQAAQMTLPQALPLAKRTHDWAQQALAQGGYPDLFGPYVKQYQDLKAKYDAIGAKYGANKTVKA